MRITEVRIKLMDDSSDRLCAFCSITLEDCFVIRDLKIIHGVKGAFVAMPSRKLTDRCPKCHFKNHLRATYCNQCGVRLHAERASKDDDGRAKLYADIAHPINSECRDQIQQMVIAAYEEELIKSQQDGYVCTYDDFEEERYASLNDESDSTVSAAAISRPHVPLTKSSRPAAKEKRPAPRTLESTDGKQFRFDNASDNPEPNAQEQSVTKNQPNESSLSDPFGEGII